MVDYEGRQFEHYHLIERIGKGGFGEVYMAEDRNRRVYVAIKILNNQVDLGDFFREVRGLVRLKGRPGIVEIIDFNDKHDPPYMVMAYAPYGSLRNRYQKGSIVSIGNIIGYVNQIAEALQYAHDEGLVHRDIKPENLLIGDQYEILVSDFGIVTTSTTFNPVLTQQGLGTWIYTAPEQILARPTRASDQYSLATVVYEWLCGSPPFQGMSPEVMAQQLYTPIPPLHTRIASIPPTIEQVVMKALAKDPAQRYPSIKDFASAFAQAYTTPPLGKTLVIFPCQKFDVQQLQWSPDGIITSYGYREDYKWEGLTGRVFSYRHVWVEYPDQYYYVETSTDGKRVAYIVSFEEEVRVLNPQKGYDIKAHTREESMQVRVVDIASRKVIFTYSGHNDVIRFIEWSPDGKRIATVSDDGIVHILDTLTGSCLLTYNKHHSYISDIQWSPDGKRIATAGDEWANSKQIVAVHVWDTATGVTSYSYKEHPYTVYKLKWSPDGKRIASCSHEGNIRVWQAI